MMATSSRKRTHLSLEKKVDLIKYAQDNPKLGVRAIAVSFDIGKTSVSDILQDKESILSAYDSNVSTHKKCRVSKFSDINEALYTWYNMACSRNVYPGGPQLVAKAKEIAVRLGKHDFQGSNGWLSKWKKRYNIRRLTICGESGDVSGETMTSWKERLPEILNGYAKENIFNLDETGCFWRALPSRGFGDMGKKCRGGKKSKQRFTITFMVNAVGVKEKPIVIWTSEKPRCFKGFDVSALPVKYYNQKNAWMNGEILSDYLTGFNRKMRAEKRSVLLLLDNAGCHPPDMLKDKFSNIKIVFFPANTTSKLKPLNLGVISNFKVHYRRLFLQYILAKIDTVNTATEITKSINVLTALRWVALAWREVKSTTIQKCFRQAGILNNGLEVQVISGEGDPFSEVDGEIEMSSLITHAMGTLHHCPVEEFIDGDNSLPVCVDDDWDECWLSSLTDEEKEHTGSEDSDEEEELDLPPLLPKLQTFKEAVESVEDVKIFLEHRNCLEPATTATSLLSELATCYASTLTQTTLDQFMQQE